MLLEKIEELLKEVNALTAQRRGGRAASHQVSQQEG